VRRGRASHHREGGVQPRFDFDECTATPADFGLNCHHPRKRVIQYSRDASDGIEKPQRTGYFAFAGYDDRL
jgi:hypothetical protein